MALQAGQSAAQVAGTGTVVSIGGLTGSTGTETFTVIGEVKDAKHSGVKKSTTPSTSFDSKGIVQKLGTLVDLGSFTFTCNRVSNNAGQLAVNAACLTTGAYDFHMQLPINPLIGQTTVGDLIVMSGIVTEAGAFSVSLDKVSEYEFTLDLNSYTVTAGS